MKHINLTQGYIALVDDADFDTVSGFRWYAVKTTHAVYARNAGGVYMHRLIMDAQKGKEVDHIDGNCLDNRRSNLRICHHHENIRNQKLSMVNTSGFRGVVWNKKKQKFHASIKHCGKNVYLGLFVSPEEAARAYDAVAMKLNGEFARLNFREAV